MTDLVLTCIVSQSSDDFTDHPSSLVSNIEGSNSGEGVLHGRGEQLVEKNSA